MGSFVRMENIGYSKPPFEGFQLPPRDLSLQTMGCSKTPPRRLGSMNPHQIVGLQDGPVAPSANSLGGFRS